MSKPSRVFVCTCGDLLHVVEFNLDALADGGLDITLIVNRQPSFVHRLKFVFSYLFLTKGSRTTWSYDGVCLSEKQKLDLIDFLIQE